MTDILCIAAAILAAKALIWVAVVSLANWLLVSDVLDVDRDKHRK